MTYHATINKLTDGSTVHDVYHDGNLAWAAPSARTARVYARWMNLPEVEARGRTMIIPAPLMDAMLRYAFGHEPVGNFLTAVFENDLSNAIGRADSQSLVLLPALVIWIYNYAPSACWGSREKVEAWINS